MVAKDKIPTDAIKELTGRLRAYYFLRIKKKNMKNKKTGAILLRKNVRPHTALFIADIISGILLLLFLYTSLSKLIHYEAFKAVLHSSPLLKSFAGVIAWLLPVTEIAIAVILFIPLTREKGLKASFVLISVFTLYLAYMVAFTPDLPCNCGGVLQFLTWPQHIFFNLFFILLTVTGILFYKKNKSRESEPPP